MAREAYLDTYSLIMLHSGERKRFSNEAARVLAKSVLFFSPMVRLEMNYLYEIGRIKIPADEIINNLKSRIPLFEDPSSFSIVIDRAEKLTWTRDTFDRTITAQAMLHKAPLITKDKTILKNYRRAVG